MKVFLLTWLILAAQDADVEKKIKDKQIALTSELKVIKASNEAAAVAEELIALSEEAYGIDLYELELKLLEQAEKVARTAKNPEIADRAKLKIKDHADIRREHANVKDAAAKLSANKDDPDANLTLGRFMVFWKSDFQRGLPLLAKGSDLFLKGVASMELSNSSTPEEKLAIGNSYWTGATSVEANLGLTGTTGTIRAVADKHLIRRVEGRFRERALFWYAAAWPGLKGLEKEKLRTLAREILRNPAAGQASGLPEGWHDMPGIKNPKGCGLDQTYSHSGKNSLKIVPSVNLRYGPFPAKNGQKFVISARVLSEKTDSIEDGFRIRVFGKSSGLGHVGPSIPTDTPFWTSIEASAIAGEGTDHIDIWIMVASKSGTVWIDDISCKCDGVELIKGGSFEK